MEVINVHPSFRHQLIFWGNFGMIKPVICEKREGVQYLPRLRQMMAGDFQEMKPGPPPLRPPTGPQSRGKGREGHPTHHARARSQELSL